jgi:hypothetical protein
VNGPPSVSLYLEFYFAWGCFSKKPKPPTLRAFVTRHVGRSYSALMLASLMIFAYFAISSSMYLAK